MTATPTELDDKSVLDANGVYISRNFVQVREAVARLEERIIAADVAMRKAAVDLDRRLEVLNHLREEVMKDRAQFLRIDTYNTQHEMIKSVIGQKYDLLRDDVNVLKIQMGKIDTKILVMTAGFFVLQACLVLAWHIFGAK